MNQKDTGTKLKSPLKQKIFCLLGYHYWYYPHNSNREQCLYCDHKYGRH